MSSHYLFDRLELVEELLACSRVGLFSDFDGTLVPIVADPSEAVLSPPSQELLRLLTARLDLVALISGRSVQDLRRMAGVEGVIYIGNHGLERWVRGRAQILEEAVPFGPSIQQVIEAVHGLSLPGLVLEDKGETLSIHYRGVRDTSRARVAILDLVSDEARSLGLRVSEGKMVIEVRPPLEMNKGLALESLVSEYSLTGVLMLGDDLTDVDAFRAVHRLVARERVKGLAISVTDAETPEPVFAEADLILDGVPDSERFLKWLAEARDLTVGS